MSDSPEHPERNQSSKDDDREQKEWARLSQLAFEFIGYIGALGYGGWWLDERYGTDGRYLLWGLLLGLVAWIYRFLRETWHLFK